MNGLTIVGAAIVIFIAAYMCYGRWLVKTWGIDPQAKTPAYKFEDGQDYAPASKFTVFAHQFSSITGAGPVADRLSQRCSAGCQRFCGCCSAVFSSGGAGFPGAVCIG